MGWEAPTSVAVTDAHLVLLSPGSGHLYLPIVPVAIFFAANRALCGEQFDGDDQLLRVIPLLDIIFFVY
jgi:hypothetical protein